MRRAKRDHPIELAGEAQMMQGVAGQRATHAVANQMGLVGAGGGKNTIDVVGDLLRQLAGINGRRGITDRIDIGPAALLQAPLQGQEVGGVTTISMDQNDRRFALHPGPDRRRIMDQPQRVTDHQQADRQPLGKYSPQSGQQQHLIALRRHL